jgi:hypothetical protein
LIMKHFVAFRNCYQFVFPGQLKLQVSLKPQPWQLGLKGALRPDSQIERENVPL